MAKFWAMLVSVFRDVPSLKNQINPGELAKAVASGLGSGTLVGVLQMVLASAGLIFAAPVVPYATAVLTIVIMVARSFTHGEDAKPGTKS